MVTLDTRGRSRKKRARKPRRRRRADEISLPDPSSILETHDVVVDKVIEDYSLSKNRYVVGGIAMTPVVATMIVWWISPSFVKTMNPATGKMETDMTKVLVLGSLLSGSVWTGMYLYLFN